MSFDYIVGIVGLLIFIGLLIKLSIVLKESIKRIPDN